MSYASLLRHRCTLLRLDPVMVGGLAGASWTAIATNVRCFADLQFIRRGRDPVWTPESGRPSERHGVLFLHPGVNGLVKSGMRVRLSRGPAGTFEIAGAIDEAWTPHRLHHLECGIEEVGSPLAQGAVIP